MSIIMPLDLEERYPELEQSGIDLFEQFNKQSLIPSIPKQYRKDIISSGLSSIMKKVFMYAYIQGATHVIAESNKERREE